MHRSIHILWVKSKIYEMNIYAIFWPRALISHDVMPQIRFILVFTLLTTCLFHLQLPHNLSITSHHPVYFHSTITLQAKNLGGTPQCINQSEKSIPPWSANQNSGSCLPGSWETTPTEMISIKSVMVKVKNAGLMPVSLVWVSLTDELAAAQF